MPATGAFIRASLRGAPCRLAVSKSSVGKLRAEAVLLVRDVLDAFEAEADGIALDIWAVPIDFSLILGVVTAFAAIAGPVTAFEARAGGVTAFDARAALVTASGAREAA